MHTNRLSKEKSPYLLQHARNPVDWYPWGDEAFERAKKEDKPVFLSIGYSTCHWCHVMAHESFEDPEVAGLMNESFVCIKVDREERPDIDAIYMSICQMMSGNCGWPLTIIITPERKPFFAATYIPKQARSGQPGMLELLPNISKIWKDRREEVTGLADGIQAALNRKSEGPDAAEPGEEALKTAYELLSARFDEVNGGFGTAPKFPSPHNLIFLLDYSKRAADERAAEMAERTLRSMRLGGIWDHVGNGFHRYSTDAEWLVPHFEKMLYDQALLALAYTEAYQATHNEEYAATARQTLDYVLRDMRSDEGGFFSAEDADSDGEEGKFYLWSESELRDLLGDEDASLAAKIFGVTKHGNFPDECSGRRTGRNILHMRATLADIASVLKTDEPALEKRLESIRGRLFAAREKRVRPHKDDKILADWNGLMVAALARAAVALGEDRFGKAAETAAAFILHRMRREGRLLHRFRDGDASFSANLEDHAFLGWGLLELYEWNFDPAHLKNALELIDEMLKHFWDKEGGGFFFTPDDGEGLLVRPKEVYDGAIPSGNSVAAYDLLRLSRIIGDPKLEEKARLLFKAFSAEVESFPAAHTFLMLALEFALGPSHEVVVAGEKGAADTNALLKALHSEFLPNTVILFKPSGEKGDEISALAPFTKEMKPLDGNATAYVCTQCTCKAPTTDPEKMLEQLGIHPPA